MVFSAFSTEKSVSSAEVKHDARQVFGIREEGEDAFDREGNPLLELEMVRHSAGLSLNHQPILNDSLCK